MSLYKMVAILILVMDPLGNIPVFWSILKKFSAKKRIKIIVRECVIAFLILIVLAFFGPLLLSGLYITKSALSTAGGCVLLIIALRMIFPRQEATKEKSERIKLEEPLIVPLAIPLTAGPSAMSVVLLFSTRYPKSQDLLVLGIAVASFLFTLVMICADWLMKFLGERVLTALERLMGMVLTTLAIQMILSGIVQYFKDPQIWFS